MSSISLLELTGKRLRFLGWPSATPDHFCCYFGDATQTITMVLKVWVSTDGNTLLHLVGEHFDYDKLYGIEWNSEDGVTAEPPLVTANRPAWCEGPLASVVAFPDGLGFAWHTRRPIAVELKDGVFFERVGGWQ